MSTPHVVRGVQHGGTISERRGASPAVVFCCGYLPRRFTLPLNRGFVLCVTKYSYKQV